MLKYTVWIIFICAIIIRFITSQPHFVNGQYLKITGTLFSEPSRGSGYIRFNLSGIKVSLSGFPDIHYGDYVTVEGIYKNGVVQKTKLDKIVVSRNILVRIRKRLIAFYENSLPSDSASLVAGITIGAKSSLPKRFLNNLNN